MYDATLTISLPAELADIAAAIGATNRVSKSNFVSGNIYPIAFGKGTITDADLLLIEKALGQMAGVTI